MTRPFFRVPAGLGKVPAVYAVLGVLLWPLPLLGLLHAESSAVAAFAAYFTAGLTSISSFQRGERLQTVLAWQTAALVVPLFFLTVTLFWRPNCAYAEGLLFYGIFPLPTVLFAVALAYAFYRWNVRRRSAWLVMIGLAISVVGPIYDIGFHPQFYTYNHVFGGFLGPIYDEELAVRPGLFVFRGLTLAWALAFMLVGWMADRRRSTRVVLGGLGVVLMLIVSAYIFAAELGLNTTSDVLKKALPGHVATAHFDIYFDPGVVSEVDRTVLADLHEYRYGRLSEMLNVEVEGRIQSFIYPDPETKANLTGARYTNVAPVWLWTPQTHVLARDVEFVVPHELAHVFSREFGLPLLRASLAVGLVEGLAVALEPPNGLPTPHEQVSAALLSSALRASSDGAHELAVMVAAHLSPTGFWTGRGAVSYTTMGSFVRYLIDAYGTAPFKQVYATGRFESVYGKDVRQLAEEWTAALLALDVVSSASGPLVAARFAVPSLFERRCPHYVPPHRAAYRRAATSFTRGDSAAALAGARLAVEREPKYVPALDLWARLMLAQGEAAAVREQLEPMAHDTMTAALHVRLGDAWALSGDAGAARAAYERALDRLPSYAHEETALVYVRIAAASRPSMMRSLVGAGTSTPPGDDATAALASALVTARAERYEQAAETLRTMPQIETSDEDAAHLDRTGVEALRRRRLVWMAHFLYRAGAHAAAAAYAETAAGEYRRAGAFNQAAQLDDFRAMTLRSGSLPARSTSGEASARTVSK